MQIEAFFNRTDRGGDISPFRTGGFKFKAKIKSKKSIFGRMSEMLDTSKRVPSATTRKFSEGFQRRSSLKAEETPKFAMTSKFKRGIAGSFGELVKSKSYQPEEANNLEQKDYVLPRIKFQDIVEENSNES